MKIKELIEKGFTPEFIMKNIELFKDDEVKKTANEKTTFTLEEVKNIFSKLKEKQQSKEKKQSKEADTEKNEKQEIINNILNNTENTTVKDEIDKDFEKLMNDLF